MLLESLLAMLLLSLGGLTLTASTRALATLADDAILVAHAQSVASSTAEVALALACDSAALAPRSFGARISTTHTDTRTTALSTRTITATLSPSPLSLRDTQRLAISTARHCP